MLGGIKSNLICYRNDSQAIISKGQEIETQFITLYDLLKKYNAPKVIHYLAMEIPFWAYESFAKALSQQEKWDEAIEVYQKANKLQPDNLKIQQELEYAKRKNRI